MNTLKVNTTSSIGFLIGVGAWSISFITLIWGYIVFRLRTGAWLAVYLNEEVLGRALMNTLVLVISSWMLRIFTKNHKEAWLILGIILGGFFLSGQWNIWTILLHQGLTLKASIAGSFFYLLTGFHAVHIVAALGILCICGLPLCRKDVSLHQQMRFQFALKFWDLLMIFWLVLLVLIFIFK